LNDVPTIEFSEITLFKRGGFKFQGGVLKTFILIDFSHGAKLVHIYGTIQAPDADAAAANIGSKIINTTHSGTIGTTRYTLKESKPGVNEWFLEEVEPLDTRPKSMTRKDRG
jgi:hypothetical protein